MSTAGRSSCPRPGTYILNFADVQPFPGETAPDFADVDYLSFHVVTFAGATPATIAVNEISTVLVPELGAAGALLCCLAGMSLRLRRAKC